MELDKYFVLMDGTVSFTEPQASAFAKGVAGDFNPIHDPGNRRFCEPGDLLFCVLLNRYGIARTTVVQFSGMLDAQTHMCLPDNADEHMHIKDTRDRALLSLHRGGENFSDTGFTEALSEAYVKFSGQTFPGILVPLMRNANVMINPDRPMVIYKDMSIELTHAKVDISGTDVSLKLSDSNISVNGRKGAVQIRFDIHFNNEVIGVGEKNMVLSGLRDFDEPAMQLIVDQYNQWRNDYVEDQCAV